jgi:hypothetical protein
MPAVLSHTARCLLHALIHGGDDWWKVETNKILRNKALDELFEHKLIEVRMPTRQCRATRRGVESNRRLLNRTNWAPCL